MGDMELQVFADRLKELRIEKGLTQAQFVNDLGITASALSAYEKNLKNPSISVAKRIAEKYNVSIDWLCGLSDSKQCTNNNIWTFSDIILLCLDTENPLFAINDVAENFTEKLNTFLGEAKHMDSLRKQELIDDELYNLWIEKSLKKYNLPIMKHYCDKIINPFT